MSESTIFAILLIGLILFSLDVLQSIYYFLFNRDVTLAGRSRNRIWCVLVNIIFIFVTIAALLRYVYGREKLFSAIAILVIGIVYFFGLRWMKAELDSVRSFSMNIMEALVGMIEARDENLDGHSIYVHELTNLIYNHLPINRRLAINPNSLMYASLFLDLGKFRVPEDILSKSGKLESWEWEKIKSHPKYGVEILSDVESFDNISDWILYHHERMDGSGYFGKRGDEIPFASRILAVADTYSALTMNRSYKATMGYEEAIAELRLDRGVRLDAEVVDAFLDIPQRYVEECLNHARDNYRFK